MLADKQPVVREDIDFLANGLAQVELIGGLSKTNTELPYGESNTSKEQEGIILTPATSMHGATSSIDTQVAGSGELHGEWLVVSRRKKVGKAGKGFNAKDGKPQRNAATFNSFGPLHKDGIIPTVFNVQGGEKEAMIDTVFTKKRLRIGINENCVPTAINGSSKSKLKDITFVHGKKGGSVLNNIHAGVKEGMIMGTSRNAINVAKKSGEGSLNALNSSLPTVHCTNSPPMQHNDISLDTNGSCGTSLQSPCFVEDGLHNNHGSNIAHSTVQAGPQFLLVFPSRDIAEDGAIIRAANEPNLDEIKNISHGLQEGDNSMDCH
ncbi:unnamed protein product [Lupinus luteus]|uniref:Uncharacterized protein n=1 Tax=Lupinus luteus TaxID=3873 RepID=A0AAV1W208_LUPLU